MNQVGKSQELVLSKNDQDRQLVKTPVPGLNKHRQNNDENYEHS